LRLSEQKQNGPDHIVDRHPAHPLPPIADLSTDAKLERREHLLQRPAVGAQDHANPQVHHPHARIARGLAGRLPITTNLPQKVARRRRGFTKRLVTPIAVVSNRRRTNKRLRLSGKPRDRLADEPRPVDTAVANPPLERFAPAAPGNVLAREMHDRIHALQPRRVDLALLRIPKQLAGRVLHWPPHRANHPRASLLELSYEPRPH
jgi:hypothetical protein